MPLEITEQQKGAVTVLAAHGPLVQEDADRFRDRAAVLFSRSHGRIVIDASMVPFVDSKGLEVLLDLNDQLLESGQSLKLCGLNTTLREVLALTELSGSFEQFQDADTAVRSFL